MSKKFLKGLYCVALMLVTLGALCFIPAIKSNAKVANADEVGSQVVNAQNNNLWTDTYAAAASAPTYTTVTRPDGTFKVIDTVDKLAYVAYMVTLQEDASWAAMNFELTADLNLEGSLWTPIGTSVNPYRGIFHGNRHLISGLRVSESSAAKSSVAGLFGYTAGATDAYAQITDLQIGSFTYITNGNPTLKAGTLLGHAGANTIIANVYDERQNKGDIATIGSVENDTVYVYRGGSPDGTTAKYTTKDEIEGTVTIGIYSSALPTSGYAVTYKQTTKSGTTGFSVANTGFYKCTSTSTYDETVKYSIYGSVLTSTGANTAVAYGNYGSLLQTRAAAMSAGTGYFAVNKGYAFTTSSTSLTSLYNSGMIVTLTWENKTYTTKVNYGYGHNAGATTTPRVMTVTVGNDYSWEEAIPTSRYTNSPVDTLYATYGRLGYTYQGRYYEPAFTNAVGGYVGDNQGYSGDEYTMYLKWAPRTDISYSVDFANATTDTGFNPKDAIRKFDIKEDGASVLSTDDIAADDKVDFNFTNHDASKTVTIEFVLNTGYKFPITGNGNTPSTTVGGDAGVYLRFADGGYDTYNETEYSISTETRTTGQGGSNETWIIISVDNIVAGNGAVTVAFEREEYTITLEGEGVTFALTDVKNAKDEADTTYTVLNGNVITTRWGESFVVTATADANKYIVAYGAQDFPMNAGVISGKGTYETGDNAYTKNFKSYAYTITGYANVLTDGKTNHKISVTAIELKVDVDISIIHNASEDYKAKATNTAAGFKSSADAETLTTGETPVTFKADLVDGMIEVYMYSNAYYTNDAGKFVVNRVIGDDKTPLTSTQPEAQLVTTGDYKGYYRYIYKFEGIIEDNKGVPTYEVQFTAVPQTYTVAYAIEVSFDGGENYVLLNAGDTNHAKLLERWFSNYPKTTPSGKFGDSTDFAYTLAARGQQELLQQDYVITANAPAEEGAAVGEAGALNEDKTAYIFGTANTTVTARFILKNPTLTLLSEGFVLDVNGQNRTVTFTDAGISYVDGSNNKLTATDIRRTATVDDAGFVPMEVQRNVASINIPTGYYFVGWYLKNGDVYTPFEGCTDVSLNALLTNSVLIDALKTSTDAVTNFDIVPAIKQKTVTLKFAKGDNALEDYVAIGATSAGQYTYYHEQENARYNVFAEGNENIRAAFAFNTMSNKVHKVGSTQTGWIAEYENAEHSFLTNGTFTSQVFESDVWAEATNFDIEFVPTWDLIQYTVKIDGSVTANIYMGDTVTVTPGEVGTETEGGATYEVRRPNGDLLSSASIAPEKGMHVTGFTFGGGVGSRTDEVTTFTLTEENIKNFLATTYYYTTGEAFNIVTKKDPNIYRLVLTTGRVGENFTAGFESDENTKYVQVTYGQQPTALAGITVTREGYRLASWVDAANPSAVLATVDEAGRFTYTGNYLTNANTTVKAIWAPKTNDEYISIATTGNNTVDYIGISQEVATATLSTPVDGETLSGVLGNGDQISAQYWAKATKVNNAYVPVSTAETLSLTSVKDSGNYVYVVEFTDTYENVTYTIASEPVTITINQNELVVNDWQLSSYYTGDNTYVAVEDTNTYGTLAFKNGVNDTNSAAALEALKGIVSFNNVKIQDATGKYNAGSYTNARYYINITEEEYANFSNIRKEIVGEGDAETTLYYVELSDSAATGKIQIVPTPVTVTVSGKGFFMGENIVHTVKSEFSVDIAEIDNFIFSATVVTKSGAIGAYNQTTQFELRGLRITLGGSTVVANSNFEFTIADEYVIEEITTENAYVYNYSVGYLTADNNDQLAGVAGTYQGGSPDYRLKVSSITVDGTAAADYSENLTFFNFVNEAGEAVVTLSGNGSGTLMIAVRRGSNVAFVVRVDELAISEKLVFLGFQAKVESAETYAGAFDDAPVADKTSPVTANASQDFYALYTDLKQITINYNAGAKASEVIYLKADVSKNIADPEWTGFKFLGWTTTNEKLGIVDAATGTNVAANNGAYTQATIEATWEIEAPAVVQNKTEITGNAIDTTITSGSIVVRVADIVTEITNRNSTDITYTYEWSGAKISTTTGETLALSNPTLAANGEYTLKVIATKGSESKTTSVKFNVNLAESTITLGAATTDLIYNAQNRNANISINYSINGVAQTSALNLAAYYDNGKVPAGKHFGFVIKYKATEASVETEVTEIKNAGIYTISLVVDGDVYAESASTATVVVKALEYQIKDSDNVRYSKAFGAKDPTMVKEMTIPGAGTVTVTFGREAGNTAGEYALNIVNWDDKQNYKLTIDESNKWFTIAEAQSNLYVELANKLTRVYDGTTATQVEVTLEGNVWTLYVKAADGTVLAQSVVNIYYLPEGSEELVQISDSANIAAAFNKVDFAIANAKNKGVYTITATAPAKGPAADDFKYDGIEFTGSIPAEYEITAKAITITAVTKEFDTNRTFTNTNVTATGILSDDTVTVSGTYSSERVAGSIAITYDALAGADAGNYVISDSSVTSGSITISDNAVTVNQAADKKAFTYGESITSDTNINQLITMLGLTVSVEDHADGANYVSITDFAITSAAYSTSGNLNVGTYTITLTLESTEYSELTGKTATVTINVKDLSIDSTTVVTKPYDGTDALPINIAWKLNGVVGNDVVTVDDSAATYTKATIDTNIAINGLTTIGADKTNYNFNSAATGTIGSVELTFNVTHPTFVDDKQTNPASKTFKVTYTGDEAAFLTAIASEKVTRTGYEQTGFTYGENMEVNSTNFADFLAKAVAAKTSGLALNAKWTIKTYTISFAATDATYELYTVVGDTETLVTGTTTFNYFTKFKVKVTGATGYKFTDARVTAGNITDFTVTGTGKKSGGEITFTLSDENATIRIDTTAITVTVKVSVTVPQFAELVAGDTADAVINFNDAAVQTATVKAGLDARGIAATAHTYNLTGWTYNKDGGVETLANETLASILGDLEDDATITFTAQWKGVEYTVTFDPTDGAITSGNTTVIAEFGKAITAFPTAELIGKVNTWNTQEDRNGRRYIVNETPLQDISEDETLTLYAIWLDSKFTLQVVFTDSNIQSVVVDGQSITTGDTFEIQFPTAKEFSVTTAEGYDFTASLADAGHGAVNKSGNVVKVERLAFNSTLTITSTPIENTLTVASVNASNDASEGVVKAYTATTAQVVFTANPGYTFHGELNVEFSGSGNIDNKLVSEDGKTLTITWAGFTNGATLKATANAVNNTVTIADCSDKVSTIAINGSAVQATGGSYAQATTGTTLTVVVTLEYGYTVAELTATNQNAETVVSGGTEHFADGIYSYEFTITGFTQDFDLAISASKRVYNINVTTDKPAEDEANEMTAVVNKTTGVEFGEEVTFTANVNNIAYLFEGWDIGGTRVSTDKVYKLTLTKALKDELENESHTLEVLAKFSYSISDVDVNLNGRGGEATYKVTKDEQAAEGTISANSKGVIEDLNMQSVLEIVLAVATGYEVESVEFLDVTGRKVEGYDWFDAEANKILIDFNKDSVPLKTINVKFIAGNASVHVVSAVEINGVLNAPNATGGKVTLVDENGANPSQTGSEFTVASKTGEVIYFLVEKNEGYTFTWRPGKGQSVTVSRIKPEEFTGNRILYMVTGYAGDIDLQAVFTAADNIVNIYFKNGDTKVSAGEIVVKESGNIVVSGNNSSDVRVSALTNSSFEITVYANFSYSFARQGDSSTMKVPNVVGSATVGSATVTSSLNAEKGYTEVVTFTISGIAQNSSIEIEVLPKEYKINFIKDPTQPAVPISGIYYDQTFTVPDSVIPEAKDGFTFNGYYTKQIGQGKQYVTGSGAPTGVWKETGYIWDGTRYIVQEGYDGKDTFNLYASYTFDKQKIFLDIIPDALKGTMKDEKNTVSIIDFVASLLTQPSWTSVDDIFYAEVLKETEIILNPYTFEGYTFHNWEFYNQKEDGSLELISSTVPTKVPTTHTYKTGTGTIRIKAVYFANYDVTIYNYRTNQNDGDCGEAYLEQNGSACEGAYDTREYITLVAKEAIGYKFYGWYDVKAEKYLSDTNGMIKGTFDNGVWEYSFDEYLTEPLSLRADFEGVEIDVVVNADAFRAHGTLRNVRVNGTPVAGFASGRAFKARVGDILTIELTPDHGYGVQFGTLGFSGVDGIYTYKIAGKDMDAATQTLTVTIVADPKPINYTFEIQVEEQTNSAELELAGSLSYRDANGTVVKIDRTTRITTLYGTTIYIDVNASANYKIGKVSLYVNGITHDISNVYIDNQKQIVLSSDILAQYNAGSDAHIIVSFSRMLWTDYRSEGVAGDGTEKNPYKITSAEDMAFVAYAVNNNLPGEDGRVAYKDASYIVTKDLDFAGKYWVPIGTATNPFNGVIDFGSHWFKNITHYTTYDPSTTTEGLIWYKTARAQIIRAESNVLLIALCSAGGALVLIGLIILIIFLVRRSKKKKMEELANS